MPWKPRTREETLLPSREKVKQEEEEEEEGGPLPLSLGGAETPPEPSSCDGDLHQHLRHLHHTKYSNHAQPRRQAKQLFHTFDVLKIHEREPWI